MIHRIGNNFEAQFFITNSINLGSYKILDPTTFGITVISLNFEDIIQ